MIIKAIRLPSKSLATPEDINKLRRILKNRECETDLRRRIDEKIASYLSQDKRRRPALPAVSIPRDKLIAKLIDSNMTCYYCKCNLSYGGLNRYDKNQWSLDRIDNSKNHQLANCIIACLGCNLRRGRKAMDIHSQWREVKVIKKTD